MNLQVASGREADTNQFAVQIENLQGQLDQLRARIAPETTLQETGEDGDNVVLARLAQEILRFRRRRDCTFGGKLFGEPAWDMLLELYVAECVDEKLSISSVCYVSGVPPTTALRCICKLEHQGWVWRLHDRWDGRRHLVFLTEKASLAMRAHLTWMTLKPI